jgi:hypothetical protein
MCSQIWAGAPSIQLPSSQTAIPRTLPGIIYTSPWFSRDKCPPSGTTPLDHMD